MASLVSVVFGLGVVFALLGLCMRVLRTYSAGLGAGRGRLPLEVVQRIAVGPKQGIAVVRIGEKVIAVSVGDGGVRPVLELDEADRQAVLAAPPAPTLALPAGLPRAEHFRAALRTALRSSAVLLLLALPFAATTPAEAQRTPTPAQAASARAAQQRVQGGDATQTVDPSLARIDSMMPRLAPQIDLQIGQRGSDGLRLSGTVGVVVMMGLLTLLPTLLLMMTSFTRILIVLHFLRQALGTQSAPPAHLMAALALLLTGFVMGPTLSEVNRTALQPWMEGRIEQGEMLATGAKPFRTFMLAETRESDIGVFMEMSQTPPVRTVDEIPLVVLMSAFVTSELKTAFQIGFAIFLPFIVIDVVVASVLMSMGMFMLPPAMIALPFKLLLFVLVDGWSLIVQGLVASFH